MNTTAAERSCPACRDNVNVRGILVYKPIYLCSPHRKLWYDADEKDRARTEKIAQGRGVTK